ncbi:hypothetical protein AB0M46_05540 [Dactylosporangium sp. NPDC051485]|uniref:hypothetical protein n=1 Tax=Dactylosporangium sp. NPDC051485 TaxID=3154846 RepID=UPI0034490967
MTISSGPFPADQQFSTRWGVTFTPWHDPDGRIGFRASRGGLTILVYLTLPADPGDGEEPSVDVCTRTSDAGEHDPDTHTGTVRLDMIGPVTVHPWTDGFSVGWHVVGLYDSRYVYLTPTVDGRPDDDVADVYVYASDSDNPRDADTALWLPIHDRTAELLIAAGPVTGPGVVFDPAAFADWFRTVDTQQALPRLATAPYDRADPDDSAGLRAQKLLIDRLPATVWRLGAGVSDVAVWPTTDARRTPAGDGGAVLTVRYGPVDLSAGHLAPDELIPRLCIAGGGTVGATALHAAIQALTAIATRVNDTIRHFVQVTDQTAADATTPAATTFETAESGARAAQQPAAAPGMAESMTAAPDDDAPGGVPVSLVTGWATQTILVDPDLEDAVVFVTVGDPAGYPLDIVGIDFNAGTVGVWAGPNDNQEWTVVHHLDADQIRDQGQPATTS